MKLNNGGDLRQDGRIAHGLHELAHCHVLCGRSVFFSPSGDGLGLHGCFVWEFRRDAWLVAAPGLGGQAGAKRFLLSTEQCIFRINCKSVHDVLCEVACGVVGFTCDEQPQASSGAIEPACHARQRLHHMRDSFEMFCMERCFVSADQSSEPAWLVRRRDVDINEHDVWDIEDQRAIAVACDDPLAFRILFDDFFANGAVGVGVKAVNVCVGSQVCKDCSCSILATLERVCRADVRPAKGPDTRASTKEIVRLRVV